MLAIFDKNSIITANELYVDIVDWAQFEMGRKPLKWFRIKHWRESPFEWSHQRQTIVFLETNPSSTILIQWTHWCSMEVFQNTWKAQIWHVNRVNVSRLELWHAQNTLLAERSNYPDSPGLTQGDFCVGENRNALLTLIGLIRKVAVFIHRNRTSLCRCDALAYKMLHWVGYKWIKIFNRFLFEGTKNATS